jgi:hypothetical protein
MKPIQEKLGEVKVLTEDNLQSHSNLVPNQRDCFERMISQNFVSSTNAVSFLSCPTFYLLPSPRQTT